MTLWVCGHPRYFEGKAELSALIEAVHKGNVVIVAKAGKPIAKLAACEAAVRAAGRAGSRASRGVGAA